MQFLKKHYEKIILSIVLLGLAVAAVLLSIAVRTVKAKIAKDTVTIEQRGQVPLKPVDLTNFESSLAYHKAPAQVDITNRHLLFSPVNWFKKPDGKVIKVTTGTELGIGAVQVTQIRPLKRIITLENVTGTADRPRYSVGLIKQGSTNRQETAKRLQSGVPQEKNRFYLIKEVRGEPLAPTELVLTWLEDESNEEIVLTKGTPHEKVTDYLVDLRYPPDNQEFRNKRLNETVTIVGDNYNIIAITDSQVVLSAERNQKRIIVPLKSAP